MENTLDTVIRVSKTTVYRKVTSLPIPTEIVSVPPAVVLIESLWEVSMKEIIQSYAQVFIVVVALVIFFAFGDCIAECFSDLGGL